jgi:hypothetical protein
MAGWLLYPVPVVVPSSVWQPFMDVMYARRRGIESWRA